MADGERTARQEETQSRWIRLVATDLDGTLLTPEGTLSQRTLAVVRRLEEERIALCLATSRRWTAVVPIAQALGLRGPLILYDGAIVRDYPAGEVLLRDPLPRETAQQAAELLAANGLRPIVQYSEDEGELLLVGPAPSGPDGAASYLADYASQVRVAPVAELGRRENPLRVVAFGSQRRLRSAARELAQLPCGRQLMKTSGYAAAELTLFSATASKGTALGALADKLGLSLAETFAIGDGVNDLAMLRMAGVSVAMGHAPYTVRRAAHHLTATNAEDGLAEALEAHVLGVKVR